MLSVLPKYNLTFIDESFIPCSDSAISIASSVPDPRSRSTSGISLSSSSVSESFLAKAEEVQTTGTSSSCRKGSYFRLGNRNTPSTIPKSILCSCNACSTLREFVSISETETFGYFSVKAAKIGGSTYWAIVVLAPRRSWPLYSLCNKCMSYSSLRYSARIRSQCSSKTFPDSVSEIVFPKRLNNRV